jgi:YcxB-like protein
MEIRFVNTAELLVAANQAILRLSPWRRWAGLLVAGGFGVAIVGIVILGGGSAVDAIEANGGFILALAAFWTIGIPWVNRWQARRSWSATPSLQGEKVFSFDEAGVSMTTPVSAVRLAWTAFVRTAETPDFFLLFHNTSQAIYIPKNALETGRDTARLRQILSAGVRPPSISKSGAAPGAAT